MSGPYLTYEQYVSNGGTAEESAFPVLERRARAKLDYWTQDRIEAADDDIRLCMTLILNALDSTQKVSQSGTVSGFSNDGVSVSLDTRTVKTEEEAMASVYDQVVEILPVELVSVVI